ncbi:MAG TPA: urate hydroxylase PuuD [Pyrinomonadaceae bacterium]|jgi:uncharacterized membrane protein
MIIDPNVTEWLNSIARWIHVFAGIMWVGSTYYFTWLDGRLTEEEKAGLADGEPAQVWMVHSGGFYVVEKQKKPGPRELHWFRWEAALTWLSGMALLIHGYYMGSYLIDTDVRDISQWTGIAIGVGLLVVAWMVYDLLVLSPLSRNELLFAAVSYVLIVFVAYFLTHTFSGRAAYIHVGAMFGTIMVANVWQRILPAQRRMIAAVSEGREPDQSHASRAKLRSKHNTFMAVPVVFLMISNHYPVTTYGHDYNWVVLSVVVLLGWGAAKIIRRA